MPRLTVVVPTLGGPARLAALLAALGEQDVDVVVVTERPEVLAGRGVRVIERTERFGPARARNLGWRAASTPYVAFVDDDCVVTAGWADALLAAAREDAVVQGPVEPHPDERHLLGPFAKTQRVTSAGPFFQTANILYPRALLERLGGFDEAFTSVAGEDTDLGWRAIEAGAEAVWAPDALVWHAVEPLGPVALARDAARWSAGVRVVARHPGLRAHLHRRVFWKPSHERLLVLALAAAARRPAAVLAAGAWWAAAHRAEHPSRGSLVRSLPGHLLVDAAEVRAMVGGSVSARTLLL